MNWAKVRRNLQRDFKRSPAKTAVLLALLPVAVYFIGPMLWKSVAGRPATGTVKKVDTPPLAIANVQPVTTQTTSMLPWRQIAAAMAIDPRMKPSPASGLRDPFRDDRPKEDVAIEEEPVESPLEEMAAEQRPEELGLQLTATIVGSRVKLATINGKQYRENGIVKINQEETDQPQDASKDASMNPWFVLRAVAKKHVILERDGKLYQLRLTQ